ncbi:uncharacterized protein LOC132904193 [Amyelois transitella]|uniref:uncharacterized protein LOC132904193 n=1 Tax=Amyelois transitella TaxID=680683 RepID=UPI00299053D8|nr:uncharacterized protein LOC132904193 [Amyelois transitella]
MSHDSKQSWLCPECRSAEPKKDNKNTPVRGAVQVQLEAENVTVRRCAGRVMRRKSSDDLPNLDSRSWDDIRVIIQEEMCKALKSTLNETIRDVVSSELRSLNDKVSSIENSLSFFNTQYEQLKTGFDDKVETIDQLQKSNEYLQSTVRDLTSRLGEMEQQMRSNNVEINGIPEYSKENLSTVLVQLAKSVDYPLDSCEVLTTTRVAKLNKDNNARPRAVVAKFRSHTTRDGLLAAISKFNKANPKDKLSSHHLGCGGGKVSVYVSEHLSPANKQLHACTRIKAKQLNYKFVWVRDGRIYIRKNETSQAIHIRSHESLKQIV